MTIRVIEGSDASLATLGPRKAPDASDELSRRIEQFDPLLRDLTAWGLVKRVEASTSPRWELSPQTQERLDQLADAAHAVDPGQLLYFGHRCAQCNVRGGTRLHEGRHLCDRCLDDGG